MNQTFTLSIGALSKATGVPIETLRTWERRYGVPGCMRTKSGHRRYSTETVQRLRKVVAALNAGHRPAAVLPLSSAALDAMLEALGERHAAGSLAVSGLGADEAADPSGEADGISVAGVRRAAAPAGPYDPIVATLLEHVQRFEGRALDRVLRRSWGDLGGMEFIRGCAAPFLMALGLAWEAGEITVAQEHFASERLRDFLVQHWRPLSDACTGPQVVCATPSGEPHVLGLHLAATVLALRDVRVVFLGADAPAQDIAETAREHGASAVLLSLSCHMDAGAARDELQAVRSGLDPAVRVICGGAGAPADLPGVEVLASFDALSDFCGELLA